MNREKLLQSVTEKVIIRNHPECETYELAVNAGALGYKDSTGKEGLYYPITIGRVMQALEISPISDGYCYTGNAICGISVDYNGDIIGDKFICKWQLTEDERECTLEDQSDETLQALDKLLT